MTFLTTLTLMEKIRVFEAFAGYGSQSMALKRLGIDFEVVGISEIDKYAIQAYMAVHGDYSSYGIGSEAFLEKEDAIKNSEERRKKKIESLKKKINKLENLKFE